MRFIIKFTNLGVTTTISAPSLIDAKGWARAQLKSWQETSVDFEVELEEGKGLCDDIGVLQR